MQRYRPIFPCSFQQTLVTMLDQCHSLQYTSTLAPDQGAITVDTIYPASEKHINKHTTQKFLMVSRHHFKARKRRKYNKAMQKLVSTCCFDMYC